MRFPVNSAGFHALELGYRIRLVQSLQASVWEVRPQDIHGVSAGLDSIRSHLVALTDRMTPLQFSHFKALRRRMERRHDMAAVSTGGPRLEVLEAVDDRHVAAQTFTQRMNESFHVEKAWQQQDWEELRLITSKAVEGDRTLESWWEIGLLVGDLIFRVRESDATATWTDLDVDELLEAVAKLPASERGWVEDVLPVNPDEPDFPALIKDAYDDIRIVLGSGRRKLGQSENVVEDDVTEDFAHSDDFRSFTWVDKSGDTHDFAFSKTQALMVKAMYVDWEQGGGGLSGRALYKAADRDRTEQRVDKIFQRSHNGKPVRHLAVEKGFILNIGSDVWRLALKTPRKKP